MTVKPDGSHYLVSADLSALNALLAETGVSYDPAVIVYQAVEQDDGNWRVSMDSLPRIGFHSKDATGAIELTNFRSSALISPAIAWLLSGSANVDKGTFQVQNPKITQTIDFGPVQETIATNVGGDGSVSTQVKEEIAELGVKAVGGGDNDTPINFSGRAEKALISLGVDGFKSRKAFDLWGLLAAHPARADLAAARSGAQGSAQGAGGARAQARRGDRSAEDRRHLVSRRGRARRISSISSARRTPGRRARSTSAFQPTA